MGVEDDPADANESAVVELRRNSVERFRSRSRYIGEGPVDVGSRIDVTTSLLWYRNVRMVCEVTRFQPDAGVFAYRVVDGPATTENEYRVLPEDNGTRFEMQGRVLLDSIPIRLSAPMLKLAEDRMARREVKRLKRLLEGD